MRENSVTLGGETFRLFYNVSVSANLIENQRPDKSIVQLLDSGRLQDMVILIVAGLDETHEKDKRNTLTQGALVKMAEMITKLIDEELSKGVDLKEVFLPVKRAIGASGISGMFLEYTDTGMVHQMGKEATVAAAS